MEETLPKSLRDLGRGEEGEEGGVHTPHYKYGVMARKASLSPFGAKAKAESEKDRERGIEPPLSVVK